jgi:hypothetical protein
MLDTFFGAVLPLKGSVFGAYYDWSGLKGVVLLSRAPSTMNLGGIAQWSLGMGHLTADTCRVEALSSTMVMLMAMQIFFP